MRQTEQKGFDPSDLVMFDQPHHDLVDASPRSQDVDEAFQLGSSSVQWEYNARKMSNSNVFDKLVRRKASPATQKLPDTGGRGEEPSVKLPSEISLEDLNISSPPYQTAGTASSPSYAPAPAEKRIEVQGKSSHLYTTSSRTTNEIQRIRMAQQSMHTVTADVNKVVENLLRPSDAFLNVMTRYLLSITAPRPQTTMKVIMKNENTGEMEETVRSVPYYLDGLLSIRDGDGGGSVSASASGNGPDDTTIQEGEWKHQLPPYVNQHERVDDDDLLRGPIPELNERPCIMGDLCEGNNWCFDHKGPAREYIAPKEKKHWLRFGEWQHLAETERQCLMCKRNVACKSVLSARLNNQPYDASKHLLVEFFNLTDTPGEYCTQQCVTNTGQYLGLYGPVAIHHPPNYKTVIVTAGELMDQGLLQIPVASSWKGRDPRAIEALRQRKVIRFVQAHFAYPPDPHGMAMGCTPTPSAQDFYLGLPQS